MKLRQLIGTLPSSLVLVSLLLSSSALPVQSSVLNKDTFQSTIAEGTWFVEHFSPYCGHCTQFKPTWDKLVDMGTKGDFKGIQLAQVNCAVDGDLCNANGVKGYPQINLYRDGKFAEVYPDPRELDRLVKYLNKNVPGATAPLVNEVVHDQMVSPNPSGTVLVLDDKNFQSTIEQGPAFIKFYAPWCSHCKKLAPTWKSLARHMQAKLTIAEVNCDDFKGLCQTQKVQNFPTLMYYSGNAKTEFNGGRKLEQLTAFAEKASAPPTKAITHDELEKTVSAHDVVYVLLHSSTDKLLLESLNPLFAPLLGSPAIYTISDPPESLTTQFGIPPATKWSLVALKDHNVISPTGKYLWSNTHPTVADTDITSWLLQNRLPSLTELNRDTFQFVMNAKHRPLVVIAGATSANKAKIEERFRDVASKWRVHTKGTGNVDDGKGNQRGVVFSWMDAETWKDYMKSMYGIKLRPAGEDLLDNVDIIISDHQDLVYYNTDPSGSPIRITSSQSIFSAIEGAATGKIKAHNSENLIERIVRKLNKGMTMVELYIATHPMHAVALLGVFVVLVFLGIRKLVSDDVGYDPKEFEKGKVGRLD